VRAVHSGAVNVFPQNVIAVIWDFDKTLIPGYMQDPLFARFGVDPQSFWDEVRDLGSQFKRGAARRVSEDTLYLELILAYVRAGAFANLNNAMLRELGRELEFHPGAPDILGDLKGLPASKAEFSRHEITVENYIVSTGLLPMIEGSPAAEYVDGIWACEFTEYAHRVGEAARQPALATPAIQAVSYALDNTGKTRAVFEINKGCNRHPDISVNACVAPEHRRVPFENMVYVADGPSDVPVFSLLRHLGGRTYAVYRDGSEVEFRQAKQLQDQQRVDSFGPADFSPGKQSHLWLRASIDEIATRIVRDRETTLNAVGSGRPQHLVAATYDRATPSDP
jgi:hypothetical protein